MNFHTKSTEQHLAEQSIEPLCTSQVLPEWPTPIHVFHSPQLTINLPGGVQYTAVPNQVWRLCVWGGGDGVFTYVRARTVVHENLPSEPLNPYI